MGISENRLSEIRNVKNQKGNFANSLAGQSILKSLRIVPLVIACFSSMEHFLTLMSLSLTETQDVPSQIRCVLDGP